MMKDCESRIPGTYTLRRSLHLLVIYAGSYLYEEGT